MALLLALLTPVALIVLPAVAHADAPASANASDDASTACTRELDAWASACATTEALTLLSTTCPAGHLVLSLRTPDGVVSVDVSVAPGFRRAGQLWVSPIGRFEDWSRAPATWQQALDRVGTCATRSSPLARARSSPSATTSTDGQAHTRVPWLLVAGLAGAVATFAWAQRRRATRGVLVDLALATALALATLALRRAAFAPGFLHQNGHGAMWVGYALCDVSPYGPGFEELFGRVVRGASAPEAAIFGAQAAASAIAVGLASLIARGVGARPWLSLVAAMPFALHPVLARAAQSESYFAATGTLLIAATWTLVWAARGAGARGARSPVFALGACAAGLLVAQAARVHPSCWIAAGTIPCALLATRGSLRRRAWLTVVATALVGACVALADGPFMLALLRGGTGQKWSPSAAQAALQWAPVALLVALAGLLARLRPRLARFAVAAVLLQIASTANMLEARWFLSPAWAFLFGAPIAACLAGGLAALWPAARTQRRAALGAVLALCAFEAPRLATDRTVPTDTRESQLVARWREHIPVGALVVHVKRAGRHLQEPPLYARCTGRMQVIEVSDESRLERLPTSGLVYYLRTSLCSTDEGRAACERLERSAKLVPVATARLPAIPSMPDLLYDDAHVDVGLYAAQPATEPAPAPGSPPPGSSSTVEPARPAP